MHQMGAASLSHCSTCQSHVLCMGRDRLVCKAYQAMVDPVSGASGPAGLSSRLEKSKASCSAWQWSPRNSCASRDLGPACRQIWMQPWQSATINSTQIARRAAHDSRRTRKSAQEGLVTGRMMMVVVVVLLLHCRPVHTPKQLHDCTRTSQRSWPAAQHGLTS